MTPRMSLRLNEHGVPVVVTRAPTPAEYRQAAETERLNPYYNERERERRAAQYLAEAERLEKINEQ